MTAGIDQAVKEFHAAAAEASDLRAKWAKFQATRDALQARLAECRDLLVELDAQRDRALVEAGYREDGEADLEKIDRDISALEREQRDARDRLSAFKNVRDQRPDVLLTAAVARAEAARERIVKIYVVDLLSPLAKQAARITKAAALLEVTLPGGGALPDADDILRLAGCTPDPSEYAAAIEATRADCPAIFEKVQ